MAPASHETVTDAIDGPHVEESHSDRKRKRFGADKLKHGRGNKRRDLGRNEFHRDQLDRRARNEEQKAKRQAQGDRPTTLPAGFAQEEIDAEDRKPKRKVAVLIGYSGTGYKGMQISPTEKTIEGDLFTAFVEAGAISKANADDPKKSALVRCARTDKGVHAAGNMISLKLIIEDPDIVEKINSHLSPQIRVWGIERTIGSFSCYQACDSRWYEYLMPSHAFLPPHPSSFLARKLEEDADEVEDRAEYEGRQAEVRDFWEKVEAEHIKPILDTLDDGLRALVAEALYNADSSTPSAQVEGGASIPKEAADVEETVKVGQPTISAQPETAAIIVNEPRLKSDDQAHDEIQPGDEHSVSQNATAEPVNPLPPNTVAGTDTASETLGNKPAQPEMDTTQRQRLQDAIKRLKVAYDGAKRAYRIPAQRISRIQSALDAYLGTRNFHNYTIQKSFKDPSAKRMIRSFVVNTTPVIINGTEWLSLKVHGQSFMMHQIRKMVGMAALLVRCGTDAATRINQSYGDVKYSIPKAPGLGLLLERPVFDTYNKQQAVKHGREQLDFSKYEKELEAFKQDEIYRKIFEEEVKDNTFHQFFNHVDNYKEPHFLYLTSKGIDATKVTQTSKGKSEGVVKLDMESDDEAGAGGEEG